MNRSELEIQQMVSPEQEVLRQMFMQCFCRLFALGISPRQLSGNRGGGWKRVLKNLVFNKDLLDHLHIMKKKMDAMCDKVPLRGIQLMEERPVPGLPARRGRDAARGLWLVSARR